jgi:hypothetical protein
MVARLRLLSSPTLEELARDIKVELDGIADGLRTNVDRAIKVGELLIQAKEAVGHGRFCRWCRENFNVSSSMLQKYMRLALYVRQANAASTPDLEGILEGGIEVALRYFRVREEDLPAAPRTDRSPDEEDDGDEHAAADRAEGLSPVDAARRVLQEHQHGARPERSALRKWVRALYTRADKALALAKCDGDWERFQGEIDAAARDQVKATAKAWNDLDEYLERLCAPLRTAAE